MKMYTNMNISVKLIILINVHKIEWLDLDSSGLCYGLLASSFDKGSGTFGFHKMHEIFGLLETPPGFQGLSYVKLVI